MRYNNRVVRRGNRTGTGNREPVHAEAREPNARTEPREPNRILRTEPDDVNRFTERCEPVHRQVCAGSPTGVKRFTERCEPVHRNV